MVIFHSYVGLQEGNGIFKDIPQFYSFGVWMFSVTYVFQDDYLVGGFKHVLFFHNTWDNPSHLTFIFFKMVKTKKAVYTSIYI